MIGIIFDQEGEKIEVIIKGNNVYFKTSQTGGQFATMENLKLSKSGCIKEHPDLKDRDDWREETIKRFKEKLKTYDTEKKKMIYIIEDLKKFGFIPLYYQEAGFRIKKIKT